MSVYRPFIVFIGTSPLALGVHLSVIARLSALCVHLSGPFIGAFIAALL
ncbi:MAG: hypothetical protein ACRDBI_12545 [Shewanella sp.]